MHGHRMLQTACIDRPIGRSRNPSSAVWQGRRRGVASGRHGRGRSSSNCAPRFDGALLAHKQRRAKMRRPELCLVCAPSSCSYLKPNLDLPGVDSELLCQLRADRKSEDGRRQGMTAVRTQRRAPHGRAPRCEHQPYVGKESAKKIVSSSAFALSLGTQRRRSPWASGLEDAMRARSTRYQFAPLVGPGAGGEGAGRAGSQGRVLASSLAPSAKAGTHLGSRVPRHPTYNLRPKTTCASQVGFRPKSEKTRPF